uniref:Uncharacterized protein n=1 Tax=Rhizophora mucronata TaxID=61149 RepID=A0A2P2MMA4_RHIMU
MSASLRGFGTAVHMRTRSKERKVKKRTMIPVAITKPIVAQA